MIRKAEIKDIPSVISLLCQVQNVHASGRPDIFRYGGKKYTEENLKSIFKDESRPVFVYEASSGEVIGYCFCVCNISEGNTSLYPRKTLYIDDLCVDKASRKHGVGKSLYEYAVSYAVENSFESVTLNVWECNPDAVRFYKGLGLTPLKTTMEHII